MGKKFAEVQRNNIDHRMAEMGHFRQINDVCAMSAFHPIATKLLHYGK